MLRSLSSCPLAAALATTTGCGPQRHLPAGPPPVIPSAFSISGTASLPHRCWLAIDDPTPHQLDQLVEQDARVLDAEDSVPSLERHEPSVKRAPMIYRIGMYRALAGGWKMTRPTADT